MASQWDRLKPFPDNAIPPVVIDALSRSHTYWADHGAPIPREQLLFDLPGAEPWLTAQSGFVPVLFNDWQHNEVTPSVVGLLYLAGPGHPLKDLQTIDQLFMLAKARYRPGVTEVRCEDLDELFRERSIDEQKRLATRINKLAGFSGLNVAIKDERPVLVVGPHSLRTPDLATWLQRKLDELSRQRRYAAIPSKTPVPVPFALRVSSIHLEHFRVLGPSFDLSVGPLTVLTGPNACGKSTVLDAIAFVGGVARDGLERRVAAAGGISRLTTFSSPGAILGIDLRFEMIRQSSRASGRYELAFGPLASSVGLVREHLSVEEPAGPRSVLSSERGVIRRLSKEGRLETSYVAPPDTGLGSPSNPGEFPFPEQLRNAFGSTWLLDSDPLRPATRGGWYLEDRSSVDRRPSVPVMDIVERLRLRSDAAAITKRIGEGLHSFVPRVSSVELVPLDAPDPEQQYAGRELVVREQGVPVPLRLDEISAGTRQLLVLCAIYFDPDPPSILLVEEPDGGVHPGAMPALRDLLRSLSGRMTVVVTSHSPAFVSLFDPEREVVALTRDATGVVAEPFAKKQADRAWMEAFDPAEAFVRIAWERGHG